MNWNNIKTVTYDEYVTCRNFFLYGRPYKEYTECVGTEGRFTNVLKMGYVNSGTTRIVSMVKW